MKVEWQFCFDAEGDQWLAVCPVLNLNAYGSTRDGMAECAQEATQLLLEDLVAENDLDGFLAERGLDMTAFSGGCVSWTERATL